ncbi:hypothetical protein F5148DRAFT_437141 [Russula earlei]|uniref:Uncharacterized protein n=1 Tax=Russula earlei TaxID=71964 RepID=A0ACC0UIJ8_9AGAM|nr:hypothetical protein F5148DRAFT_437141 [Russula earlei]
MPVERTRSLKKEKVEVDGIRLTWTDPVESLAPQQIAFAPAVTPGTFTDELPVEGVEPAPSLFPTTLDGVGPKRPGHGKKKADDHIPRPPNAFILFRSSFIKCRHVSTEVETNHSTLSKIIGLTWQNMPHEERQIWHSKAKIAQAEHKRKFPDYAFRPSHVKAKGTTEKRKVREVGPKDMKRCAKIAQLLVEGKKGADLRAAVEEFDKNHVPTVVTRFDTPITARSFRRSLSEPAPDTDPSAPAFLCSDPRSSSRRLRATSSQPTMSRPPTPGAQETMVSSPPSSSISVFGSSPFANFSENTDTPSDAIWHDMPPLVLPPIGFIDGSFVSKDSPSLDFNTFVFNEAPAKCIDSIDPLSPAPNTELYSAFHAETAACTAGSFAPQLAIDMSFLDSWPVSPFPSSPRTPMSSYTGGPFSPVEAVPALSTPTLNTYNMMSPFDSCGTVGFDCNQVTALSPESLGSDPLVHVPHPHHQHSYSASKGSLPFFSHKVPIPDVAGMDGTGYTDLFMQSSQVFTF